MYTCVRASEYTAELVTAVSTGAPAQVLELGSGDLGPGPGRHTLHNHGFPHSFTTWKKCQKNIGKCSGRFVGYISSGTALLTEKKSFFAGKCHDFICKDELSMEQKLKEYK